MQDAFALMEEGDREKVLELACTKIENKLSDMKYMAEFTWNGKQAFYNDELFDGTKNTFNTTGEHLKDEFYVSLDATSSNFLISNPKMVYSSKGAYNLFDLLWGGFGAYHSPRVNMSGMSYQEQAYLKKFGVMSPAMQKMYGESNRISFYYRYAGKSFYNVTDRGPMSSSLVNKFQSYIEMAIGRGLKEAIQSIIPEESHELMGAE